MIVKQKKTQRVSLEKDRAVVRTSKGIFSFRFLSGNYHTVVFKEF